MPSRFWHVYIHGETLGPLATETVVLMLNQGRLQFLDFVWAAHLTKWQRIADLDDFQAHIPAYPKVPIPAESAAAAPVARAELARAAQPVPAKSAPFLTPELKPAAPEEKKSWVKIRRFIRVPANTERAVLGEHGAYEVLNISEGGIFLEAKAPLPIGTDVNVSLELVSLEKKFEMTGVVIRHGVVDGIAGMAIEFTRLNPAHKRALQTYIDERHSSAQE